MVAHIWPEVKSRYSRPSLSVTIVPFAEVKRFGKTSPPYLTRNSSAAAFSADVMRAPRPSEVDATAALLCDAAPLVVRGSVLARICCFRRFAVRELTEPMRYVPGSWDERHFKKLSSR